MNFLIDQQLPATLGAWFIEGGHQATHVRAVGMRDASDSEVWRYAIAHSAIIVTKDEDFALRLQQASGPQVLWLRIGNATNHALRAHLDAAWPVAQQWLEQGEPIVEA